MTQVEWAGVVVATLLLTAGLPIGPLAALRAGARWRRARRALERGESDPWSRAPGSYRAAWARYRALVEQAPADGDRRLVVAERVLAPERLTPELTSGAGGLGFGLLWAAWGGAMAAAVLASGGAAGEAAAWAAGGGAAGAGWSGLGLLSLRSARAQARHFFLTLEARDGTVGAEALPVETEVRAEADRLTRRAADARQIALLESQSEALGRVAPHVAAEVRTVLEASLMPALLSMVQALDRISATVEERQRAALDEMARSFKVQLTAGFRDEFDALARALRDAAEWHERVQRDLGALLADTEKLGEGHVAMLRRTLQVTEAVRGNAESLARAERSLALTADRVQASSTRITESLEGTTETVVDRLQTASREMADQLTRLTGTLNEQMDQTGEQLSRRIQSITLMLQRVAGDIDTLSREQRSRPGGSFPRGY